MRAPFPLIFSAALVMSLAGCESVMMIPANEDIRAETFCLLSVADIHAIERLAAAVAPHRDVHSIHATSRDQVSVECGEPHTEYAEMLSFTAHRKNGHWVADKKSIGTYRPIIVN